MIFLISDLPLAITTCVLFQGRTATANADRVQDG